MDLERLLGRGTASSVDEPGSDRRRPLQHPIGCRDRAAGSPPGSRSCPARDQPEGACPFLIRDAEQSRLISEGVQVRTYIPFGHDWYGYFMRRLAERPANLTFFLRSLVSRN